MSNFPALDQGARADWVARVTADAPINAPRRSSRYLDGNDPRHFEDFAARVRAMSDKDVRERFGIASERTLTMLRELVQP